jgi:hypothetical protein
MKELFSLGDLYVSDFLKMDEQPSIEKIEMKLCLEEETGAVRLEKVVPPKNLYGRYWYQSGTNQSMRNELKRIVDSIVEIKQLNENDVWLDIACNDGTLLEFVPKEVIKVGIDPIEKKFKEIAEKRCDDFIQDFFSKKTYKKGKFGKQKPKVITTIAMFYDLDNPSQFIKDVHDILDNDGLWVLQMSYTPLMISQMAFDNICHEHIYYYSLFNIKKLFEDNGFKIMDCQLNDTNGGSFRIYVMKSKSNKKNFSSQPHRDVCEFRINSLLEYEKSLKLEEVSTWKSFFGKIQELKEQLVSFLKTEKLKGKKIWAYGASTKGNTLLQYFGINNELIDGIAERSIYKWGLKTVGTNIPIYSEDEMRKANPDYLLILPWHFIQEFKEREKEYLMKGGKFIVPCPKFEII